MEAAAAQISLTPTPYPTPAWSGCMQTISQDVQIPTVKCIEVLYNNLLAVVISLVVLILFVMLVIGGFKYLTSGSDPAKLAEAKKTLLYAVAGIGFIAVSYLLLRIIEAFTGVKLTIFQIQTD